jgi:hypothetical protein
MRSNVMGPALLGAALLVLPAHAWASSDDDHPIELLLNLGIGVNRTSDAPGFALRYGFSGAYWLTSATGVGLQAMGFDNIASLAQNSLGCQPNEPCYSGDPRNRSGWLVEPRFFVGRSVSIVRFYGAVGLGLAREDVPVVPSQSYFSLVGSLEAGASVHLWRLSIVPALRLDAMDGAASALLQLGIGANL